MEMGRTDGTEGALLIIGEITINALLHTHPTRMGAGRLSFRCSSARVACGCPFGVSVSSRSMYRTCVSHNPPLAVGVGGGLVFVRVLVATWGSGPIRNGSVARYTFDGGELEQADPRATFAPMLFSAGWVCSAVASFPAMRFCGFSGSSRIVSSMNFGVTSVSRSSP